MMDIESRIREADHAFRKEHPSSCAAPNLLVIGTDLLEELQNALAPHQFRRDRESTDPHYVPPKRPRLTSYMGMLVAPCANDGVLHVARMVRGA